MTAKQTKTKTHVDKECIYKDATKLGLNMRKALDLTNDCKKTKFILSDSSPSHAYGWYQKLMVTVMLRIGYKVNLLATRYQYRKDEEV